MAEALYYDRARLHRQRWSTVDLVTAPEEEDGPRLCLGGYVVVWPQYNMDNSDIKRIVSCAHKNYGEVGTPLGWMLRPPYRWMRVEIASAPSDPLRVLAYWVPLMDLLRKAFQLNLGVISHCKAGVTEQQQCRRPLS